MALPDNRIRLSSNKINFSLEYGTKGQDIDDYPPEGGQARFDHMRAIVLGLLGQQSSYDEPINYRDGTPWFDLNTNELKIHLNGSWVPYSDAIKLTDGISSVSLSNWYQSVEDSLIGSSPDVTFSGSVTSVNTNNITIPTSLRPYIQEDARAMVYRNGLLIDPRNTVLDSTSNPTKVVLQSNLLQGDTFTVIFRRIPDALFYQANVVI